MSMDPIDATQGMPIYCKAAVAWEPSEPLKIETVEVDVPKEGEVRIKPKHIWRQVDPLLGIVVHWSTQGRGLMPDGTTRFTCQGRKIFHFMGVSTFSEYTVVAEISLCKINPSAPLDKVCLLGCAVSTGYGAALNVVKLTKDSTVAIWGLGAVGLAVAMGAKERGCKTIIGIDINPSKFPKAEEFGCTECVNPNSLQLPLVQYLTEKTDGGLDFTFECIGNVGTMMTMQVTVEGEDISPEEFQCAGWQSAFTKRKSSQKCLPAESEQPANTPSGSSNGGSRTPASVKKRLVAASRMPRLPKEHFRVIVRPRGGINVKNVSQVKIAQALVTAAGLSFTNAAEDIICPNAVQNILVVSTPSEHNAKTYARVEAISIGSAIYVVSSYLAAPDNTCKGIIRNIDLELDHEQLRSLIVQPRNPMALEARRIKNSTTVVILFDGLKVPNYVMCGLSMLRCTLYRRQTEVCYACGRLGHRADVCPTPENVVCRGCGVNSPSDQHVCSPKCALCGGPHPTADKSCKQRYQVPYIVRQRRKERRDYNQDFPPMGPLSRPAVPPRAGSGSRGPGITRVPSRGRSRETGWADRVKGSPTQVTGGTLPEQHNTRIVQLERENAALKGTIEQLRSEMVELRSARKREASQPPQAPKPEREETSMEVPVEAPSEARTAKKRALTNPVRDEGPDEFQTEMRVLLKSLSEAVAMLNDKVDALYGKFNALEARVGSLEARRGTMEFCALANNEPSPTGNPASFGAQHLQAASPCSMVQDRLTG
ncbi:hypothetical protein HPB47_000862, partial [Ixodes persulcatus]